MTIPVIAYQHGLYPRSEEVVAATRGLERGRTSAQEVAAAFQRDREDFVAVQRDAGLDLFSDGLLEWQDLFRPLVEASAGMEARTLVRWFDTNSFFRAPEVSGPVGLERTPELFEVAEAVPEPRVASLPSPFMFSRAAQTNGDRDALMLELAREVLGPAAGELARRGHRVVQLQEPWLVYFGIEAPVWDNFEKALGEVRGELEPAGAALVLHTCFGDAAPHVDRLRQLPVDAVGIDFVRTDLDSLGSGWEPGILAGCLDGRRSPLEPVDGTVRFVERVVERLQPPALYLSSASDLELLPRDVARRKVLVLGEVAARVREALR